MRKYLLIILFFCLLPNISLAANLGLDYAANLELPAYSGDMREILITIVRFLLTWLGILAVGVILLGGLRWMVSMGNEDRLATAKATITSGIIGLVLILSSFAIVNFVIRATGDALGGGLVI